MESRRRDKLDASYITGLKIVQGSSELDSNITSTESLSDMDASKPMKYESITRPVPTVPSKMVLTPPRLTQPKAKPETKKKCVQLPNLDKLHRKVSEKVLRKDEPPSLFWIENHTNFEKSSKKITNKRTDYSKYISVTIKRNDTVLN